MESPQLIKGGCYKDDRGRLAYNNSFNAFSVKRVYIIENVDTTFVRAWQGHKIERRWFSAVKGAFEIKLVRVDDWKSPSKDLKQHTFLLEGEAMDILAIPSGYISSIRAMKKGSRLLIMADYALGEVKDEYRYAVDYFKD